MFEGEGAERAVKGLGLERQLLLEVVNKEPDGADPRTSARLGEHPFGEIQGGDLGPSLS